MRATEASLGDLGVLPRESLRDRAQDSLRSAIVLGQLPPGSHLSEVALAGQLGISRGTLREALRVLQREGLAVADSRGRLRVPDLTPASITEIFQVREALEAMAGHLVVSVSPAPRSLPALRERVRGMELSRSNGILDQVEADLRFHRTLCELSGNRALLSSWDDLVGLVRMSILFAGPEKAMANMSPARHAAIVDVLETGETVEAITHLHQHFQEALAVLTGQLER